MITTVSLLYDLDLRLNKVATNISQSIPEEDKIIALNDAQIKLIKNKLGPDRIHGLGLDGFKKKYEDLENLIEPHIQTTVVKDKISKLNKYVVNTTALDPKYMYYVDSYFLCNKGICKDRIVTTHRVHHADIHKALNNTNTNPSFEYQEAPVTSTNGFLEFYTDGTFEPTAAYISFVRYPKMIDIAGYVHLDNTASIDQDCELKEYLADELVNLAVIQLGSDTANQIAVVAAQNDQNT